MKQVESITSALVQRFQDALDAQVQTAIARRIHSRVRDARSNPYRAARRWPFELIQNAHDAGERDGRQGVSVSFELVNGNLRFSHDAAPFDLDDLAALITGGSSKDFNAPGTTGRFGTGFLVTHVLSETMTVSGVLRVDDIYRQFDVTLKRPDDESSILQSLQDAKAELGNTHVTDNFNDLPTACIGCVVDNADAAMIGLESLENSLPYLFGSCRRLREVRIQRDLVSTQWRRLDTTQRPVERNDAWFDEVRVSRTDSHGAPEEWNVVRVEPRIDAHGRLLVALRKSADAWLVSKPRSAASVFRQLPVIGGPTLPAWFVVDGDFELDPERSMVYVQGEAIQPLQEAFGVLPSLAQVAVQEGWAGGLRILQLGQPDGLDDLASEVWMNLLASSARDLASRPLANTVHLGLLPIIRTDAFDHWTDVLVRAASLGDHDELWSLASKCEGVDVPVNSDSALWSEIADGWESLGLSITRVDLVSIGKCASEDAHQIDQLAVIGNRTEWLAKYLNAVGKLWREEGITKSSVGRLLPDQLGKLHDFGELRIDGGISHRVKVIAASIGIDLRAQLISEELIAELSRCTLLDGSDAVRESTQGILSEEEALDDVVKSLGNKLPDEKIIGVNDKHLAAASIDLLEYLSRASMEGAGKLAWQVPLIAADGSARRAGQRRKMVPPVQLWPEQARPFSGAYPPNRVLAADYAGCTNADEILRALVEWGIAHSSLIEIGRRDELRDRALAVIAADPNDVKEARLRDVEFSQLALLEPEVINYCRQTRESAQALLGLIVCYVAASDESWKSSIEADVRLAGGSRQVRLTPSLWLSDLRSKAWIPVEHDEGITYHGPDPELIRELVLPGWLECNQDGADLLVRHFGMDSLEVHLLAAAPDEGARQKIRDSLARIVQVARYDLQTIENIVARTEQRQREVDRMRRIGLAVQARVAARLKAYGLYVQDIDRGFDLLVTDVDVREEDEDDISAYFHVGSYMIEVKATTADEAKLTPLQAATAVASPSTFVLCVVDLRGLDSALDVSELEGLDITGLCHFVPGDKLPIEEPLNLVRSAVDSAVPVRNVSALRYAVKSDIWIEGTKLDAWVAAVFQ